MLLCKAINHKLPALNRKENFFMNNFRVRVDKNACIGCGLCVDICPNVFELDPQGLSESTIATIEPSFNNSLKQAQNACPTNAIALY